MAVDPKQTKVPSSRSKRLRATSPPEFGLIKSLANLERMLAEELSGSIIGQMLLNACDALPNGDRQGIVRLAIARDALYVANRGRRVTWPGLAEGVCLVGEAPRESGEGFGRKGVGLRGALALSKRPELFSGPLPDARERLFDLQLRFDAMQTQRELAGQSPEAWQELPVEWREDLTGPGGFPVFLLPHPLQIATSGVRKDLLRSISLESGDAPLDTVWRLPMPGLDEERWLQDVRRHVHAVSQSDLAWVLLFRLERVLIEDWAAGTVEEIRIAREALPDFPGERVRVRRTREGQAVCDSEWLWIEERTAVGGEMGRRVACVFPLQGAEGGLAAPLPLDEEAQLPFYVWADFQTDLSGRRLSGAHAAENRRRLHAALDLFRRFIGHAVADEASWCRPVLDEVLPAWQPEAPAHPLLQEFQQGLLQALREGAWVQSAREGRLRPEQLVMAGEWQGLAQQAMPEQRFPQRPSPILEQLGARRLDVPLIESWLRSAEVAKAGLTAWHSLVDLLRRRYRQPGELEKVIDQLRRDASIRLLPVLGDGDRVDWAALPGVRPVRGQDAVIRYWPTPRMVRANSALPVKLLHPQCVWRPDSKGGQWLDEEYLAFLRHILMVKPLAAEELIALLSGMEGDEGAWRTMGQWLFALLGRLEAGELSFRRLIGKPFHQVLGDPGDCTRQAEDVRGWQRELGLLRLPGRDGQLHRAHELLMGHEWDDGSGDQTALESLYAPLKAAFAASPKALAAWLPLDLLADELTVGDAELAGVALGVVEPGAKLPPLAALNGDERERIHWGLMRAFLLRVGVAALPPIVAVVGETGADFELRDFARLVAEPEGASVLLRLLNRHWEGYGQDFLRARGPGALSRPSRFQEQLRGSRWLPHVAGDLSRIGADGEAVGWWQAEGESSAWRFVERISSPLHPLLADALQVTSLAQMSGEQTVAWLERLQRRWERGLEAVVNGDPQAQKAWMALHERLYRQLAGQAHGLKMTDLAVLARESDRLAFVSPGQARFAPSRTHAAGVAVASLGAGLAALAGQWGIKPLQVEERWLWPHGEPLDVTQEVKARLKPMFPRLAAEMDRQSLRCLYGEAYLRSSRFEGRDAEITALSGVHAAGEGAVTLAIDLPPDQWGDLLVPQIVACLARLWGSEPGEGQAVEGMVWMAEALKAAEVPSGVDRWSRPGHAWRLPSGGGVKQTEDGRALGLAMALWVKPAWESGAMRKAGEQLAAWLLEAFQPASDLAARVTAHRQALSSAADAKAQVVHLVALMGLGRELAGHCMHFAAWNLDTQQPVAVVVRSVRGHGDDVGLLAGEWALAQRLRARFAVIKVKVTAGFPEERFQILTDPSQRA